LSDKDQPAELRRVSPIAGYDVSGVTYPAHMAHSGFTGMADAVPIVEAESGNGWDGETAQRLALLRVRTSSGERIYSMSSAFARRVAQMLVDAADLADES
jgi:hypothetical protein